MLQAVQKDQDGERSAALSLYCSALEHFVPAIHCKIQTHQLQFTASVFIHQHSLIISSYRWNRHTEERSSQTKGASYLLNSFLNNHHTNTQTRSHTNMNQCFTDERTVDVIGVFQVNQYVSRAEELKALVKSDNRISFEEAKCTRNTLIGKLYKPLHNNFRWASTFFTSVTEMSRNQPRLLAALELASAAVARVTVSTDDWQISQLCWIVGNCVVFAGGERRWRLGHSWFLSAEFGWNASGSRGWASLFLSNHFLMKCKSDVLIKVIWWGGWSRGSRWAEMMPGQRVWYDLCHLDLILNSSLHFSLLLNTERNENAYLEDWVSPPDLCRTEALPQGFFWLLNVSTRAAFRIQTHRFPFRSVSVSLNEKWRGFLMFLSRSQLKLKAVGEICSTARWEHLLCVTWWLCVSEPLHSSVTWRLRVDTKRIFSLVD